MLSKHRSLFDGHGLTGLFKVVDHSSMHDTSTVTDYVEPESKFLASDRKNRNV